VVCVVRVAWRGVTGLVKGCCRGRRSLGSLRERDYGPRTCIARMSYKTTSYIQSRILGARWKERVRLAWVRRVTTGFMLPDGIERIRLDHGTPTLSLGMDGGPVSDQKGGRECLGRRVD
jgi:hypothetical protein